MKQLKKHELNFYTRYTAKAEKAKANRKKLIMVMPFIAIVLAVAGIFAYFQSQVVMYTNMIAEEKIIINDEQNISTANLVDNYNMQSDLYSSESDALTAFNKIRSSYPVNGSEEIKKIFSCAESKRVSINSILIGSESGIIEIVGSAAAESDIPQFIRELKATELFSYVNYEGYSGSGTKTDSESYSFSVQMKRKAIMDISDFDEYMGNKSYFNYNDEYDDEE